MIYGALLERHRSVPQLRRKGNLFRAPQLARVPQLRRCGNLGCARIPQLRWKGSLFRVPQLARVPQLRRKGNLGQLRRRGNLGQLRAAPASLSLQRVRFQRRHLFVPRAAQRCHGRVNQITTSIIAAAVMPSQLVRVGIVQSTRKTIATAVVQASLKMNPAVQVFGRTAVIQASLNMNPM